MEVDSQTIGISVGRIGPWQDPEPWLGCVRPAPTVARKRGPLRGTAEIALAVGAVINRYKMAKHFDRDITDASFSFARKTAEIAAEAANDGIYVTRTSLPVEILNDDAAVRSYKSFALVERAFRCIKTVDLQVRPVHHWQADRVRAHVFLCMLAYYLEWHMRQRLAPMLFDDTDKETAEALRRSVVAPAQRSPAAFKKQTTGLTEDGLPVHSFRSLLADLTTLTRNTITTAITPAHPLTVVTATIDPTEGVRSPWHQVHPVAQRPAGRLSLQFNRLRACCTGISG